MSVGSSYAAVKNALVTLLQARTGLANVKVSSQEPLNATDLTGSDGTQDAIWIADTDGTYDDQCFRALPLAFDETYGLKIAVQALRATTVGTQVAADLRVDQLLYEVLQTVATDPTLGLGTTFNYLFALPSTFQRHGGFLPTGGGHGSRCDLTIEVQCRHTF